MPRTDLVESGLRVTVYLPAETKARGFKLAETRGRSFSKLVTEMIENNADSGSTVMMNIDGAWLPQSLIPAYYRSRAKATHIKDAIEYKGTQFKGGLVIWWETEPRPGDVILTKKTVAVCGDEPPANTVGVVLAVLPVA